jgi:MYXO-CTERM domain-containing protein
MIGTMLLGLGLVAGNANAGGSPKLVRYDSYADDGDFTWGAYFTEAPGFGKFNCMAQVYSFEDADFPLVPTQLRMFWAGEGAGAASEVLLKIYFYHYEGQAADEWTMAAGQYTLLDQEIVLLEGISLDGTWVELDLAMNGFDFDGDPDLDGKQPLTYGSVVANVCYENDQNSPAIAFDNDGYRVEPIPEDDEDIVSGHETSQFRSLIYWNGLWANLYNYLLYTFEYPDGGDLIMRLVIDAQWEEDDDDGIVGDLSLRSVSPQSQEQGNFATMLITGEGIDANATAFVGSEPLLDVIVRATSITEDDGDITSGHALNGKTNPDLELGDYDVTVRNPNGDEFVLEDAFSVVESTKGCGCAAAGDPSRAVWWVPLIGLGLVVRRRR